ncbi:Cysteine-rich receptor-like protein kinase 25 [Nymphaea thermarum]|nr:Cysteine-rich receptor-like protein kinase 25 [Nymphaea thermarum]
MLKDVAYSTGCTVLYNFECYVSYDIYPFFAPPPRKIPAINAVFTSTNCSPPASRNKVGSPFHRNLKALLNHLIVHAPSSGFYSDTDGLGSSQVYGQAFCRGDVLRDVCWYCIAQASIKIQELCPNSEKAIIWLDRCQLRYSDENFAGKVDVYDRACQPAAENASNPVSFDQNLRILISNLTSLAVQSSPNRFFATGTSLPMDSQKIYALVQCVIDIPADQCGWCLQNATSDIEGCSNGKQGGRILRGSCSLAFGVQPFFLGNPIMVSLPQPNHESEATLVDSESAEENMATYDLPHFSLRTIEDATDTFSESNKLGEGGYGPVYKGNLPDGQEVAVKRLSGRSRQGFKEFRNEVELIAKLQHTNLVRLVGCCLEKGEKILIYEYVPNKSLDFFLKDPKRRASLDWEKRFNIIKGIARGMLYLHQDSRLNIIHRDLKASNVLLDDQLHPKISDFGLARIFNGGLGQAITRVIVGTYGYMAPEYAMGGVFSTKTDVYSFGILMLEVISGRLNSASICYTHDQRYGLVEHAWSLWCEEEGTEFIDPFLKDGTSTSDQMLRCLHIGFLCIQEDAATRPTMSRVVLMLGNDSFVLPLPTQPAVIGENAAESSVRRSSFIRPVASEGSTSFVFLIALLLSPGLVDMAENPNWICLGSSNYIANSTFGHNLEQALAFLVANVSFTGFYNDTVGKSLDQVIAVAQCRGDLDGEACEVCVSYAASQVALRCPKNKAAWISIHSCAIYVADANFTIPQSLKNVSVPNKLSPKSCKSCLDGAVALMLKDVAFSEGATAMYNLECFVNYGIFPSFAPPLHKIPPSSAIFISTNCSPPASSNKVGSPFHRNLKALLNHLIVRAPLSGSYSDTVGLGSSQVYGQAFCRGDVLREVCWYCIAQASIKIQELCPNSERAIIWLDRCQLRYSDENFAGKVDVYDRACQPAAENASNPVSFDQNLRILISNLTSLAVQSSSNRFFATGTSLSVNSQKIYALVQCVIDIPADQCGWCLQNASSDIEGCSNGNQGGRILRGSCSLAFGVQPFFLGNPIMVSLPQPNHDKLKKSEATLVDSESAEENVATYDLPHFSLRTIEDATDTFSESNKLGQGGYGPVYKGNLRDGQEVAVKRLSGRSRQGFKEFRNEVELIAKLQHTNLVRLVGCCLEKGEKILVYEYVPNKSLDFFLKDPKRRASLDWEKRFNIIKGIAKGMLYLHQDSRLNIIHRDLKASNVLLDDQLHPKISDFGLARIFNGGQGQAITRVVVESTNALSFLSNSGYMAPEYAMGGVFSTKSDAWSLWCEENGTEFIDPFLDGNSTSDQMLRCLQIGFLCIQEDAATRPTMSRVVLMLGNDSFVLPLPTQPAVIGENAAESSVRRSSFIRPVASEGSTRTERCFLFLIVLLLPLGFVDMTETHFWYCSGSSNYKANSTFSHNLQRALASVVANVSLTSFYNVTMGKSPDQAFAAAQCRGDLDGEACQVCVSDAAAQVAQLCPQNRAAIIFFESCIMYYRDANFTVPQSFMNLSLPRTEAIPDPQRFRPILISFFNKLILYTTTNPSGRLFWGDMFRYTQNLTIYATAQCVQYLSPKGCRSCLDIAFAQMLKNFADRQGGVVYHNIECLVRFEPFSFFTPPPHKIDPNNGASFSSNCSQPTSSNKVGTPFHKNLKALLSYLIENAPLSGFYNDTVGLGSGQVYGQALCRGDIPNDVCWHCTAQASSKIQELCPNSRRAIIWLDHCQLRYSDENFGGMVDVSDGACQPAEEKASDPSCFYQNLRILISNLTSLAMQSSSNHFFATGISVIPCYRNIRNS